MRIFYSTVLQRGNSADLHITPSARCYSRHLAVADTGAITGSWHQNMGAFSCLRASFGWDRTTGALELDHRNSLYGKMEFINEDFAAWMILSLWNSQRIIIISFCKEVGSKCWFLNPPHQRHIRPNLYNTKHLCSYKLTRTIMCCCEVALSRVHIACIGSRLTTAAVALYKQWWLIWTGPGAKRASYSSDAKSFVGCSALDCSTADNSISLHG